MNPRKNGFNGLNRFDGSNDGNGINRDHILRITLFHLRWE